MKAKPTYEELERRVQELENKQVVTDIAESKQAEIELKESERFLQILLESIPVPVFYKDVEGRYKGFNKEFETFFGRPKSELIGCSVFDINPPDLARRYHAKDSELFKKISTQVYESQVNKAYGELRDVVFHKATLTNTSGDITGLVGAIMDITDRKRAEEQLQKSEEQFRNLYNDAPVGYFEYDLRGNITRVNHTQSKLLGYTAEEMIGQPCWKFIVDEVAREQILDKLRGVRPPAVGLERTYRRKDGTTFPVLFEDRVLTDEDGNITGIRTAIQDIHVCS
ncbi:MAG: PAS domain S-box protein [Desulfobacteraceae bacterium]|nr:PAS domain S-box protein [Desulfobacteraceae bacterium]